MERGEDNATLVVKLVSLEGKNRCLNFGLGPDCGKAGLEGPAFGLQPVLQKRPEKAHWSSPDLWRADLVDPLDYSRYSKR